MIDVDYPAYKDLPFLPEKLVINEDNKLACFFHNEKNISVTSDYYNKS